MACKCIEDLRVVYAERVEILEEEREVLGEFWDQTDELELELTKGFLRKLG